MKTKCYFFRHLFTIVFVLCAGMVGAQVPNVTSFFPNGGSIGALVTISGTNLTNPTAVSIGGTAAVIVTKTATSIVAMVMPGATTGTVSVTTAGGTDAGPSNFIVGATPYPSVQQGTKLVGTGNTIEPEQGYAVAISANGTTAAVGGHYDNSGVGAVWVHTRSGSTWAQQGVKLVGTGAVGNAGQGTSLAISADGNTIIMGGIYDNNQIGAAWIFVRNGSTWTQQGSKLVGTSAIGNTRQGQSVALSADGNTAIVGGGSDNLSAGAAWVYTRSGTTWTQQGSKLVGTGAVGNAWQGWSVALSANGNTAISCGYLDDDGVGATWVFTRSGSTWTQQGTKLVGTGGVGYSDQGSSVSLSASGNTVIVGGSDDNNLAGGAWIFNRVGTTWTQQSGKLVGTGAVGAASQGQSVSISADGNSAIVGGDHDNGNIGAFWVYTRSGSTWTQQGAKRVGTGIVGASRQGCSVALSANGSTAIIGAKDDNNYVGAAWIFTPSTPLSIQLSSINAYAKNTGAEVTWTVANETNGDHYEVERSADGKAFTMVGEVVVKNKTEYTWYDARAIKGNNYYRVKTVDNTGEENYSSTVQVNLNEINSGSKTVSVYPNPVKGNEITLQMNNVTAGEYNLSIINALGQQVYQQSMPSNEGVIKQRIQLPQLPAGLYSLSVKASDGVMINTRFTIGN